jgi:DNA-binding transcriptional LysR family regulator
MTKKSPHRDERQLDVFSLRCLVALTKDLSVSAAAERVGISQPAMSQILGRLRVLSGDPLLIRSANTMLPTNRALVLAEAAERAIDLLEGAFWRQRKFVAAEASRLFSIMASDYIQSVFFPPLMQRFLVQSPKSSIRAIMPDLDRLHRDLESGPVDLAIGFFTNLAPSLRSIGLFRDSLVCAVPRTRFGQRRSIGFDEFMSLNHVVFFTEQSGSSTMERHTDHALSLRGGERRIALHAQNMTTMLDGVGRHGLVATVPARLVDQQRHPQVKFLPLPFEVPDFVLSMVWHERNHRETANVWLRGVARDAANVLRVQNKESR